MNSNIPKSSTQMNKATNLASFPNLNNEIHKNRNKTPINRVSILKTEEQKEIVRTEVYDPNNNSLGDDQHFSVVTEIVRRSSNISLEPQHISFNNGHLNFSFNNSNSENLMNQSFQNKAININLADSSSKKYENKNINKNMSIEYKLLIKRIASQLKKRVHTPTQGYFYLAFQKGEYPLMIIRKIQTKMINHEIEFNNNIFKIYIQKYAKYKELIKRIAFLLKKSLKNPRFWENQKYLAQTSQIKSLNENENKNIQVKIAQNTFINNIDLNVNNSNIHNSIQSANISVINNNKNVISKKTNAHNKKNINSKNNRTNSNDTKNIFKSQKTQNTNLNLNNPKKSKPQTNKINYLKNNTNNINKISNNKNNIGSNKTNTYINSFVSVKDRKNKNLSKSNDKINKNQILNKSKQNKNKNNINQNSNNTSSNNINTKIETNIVTSTINQTEKMAIEDIDKSNNLGNEIIIQDNQFQKPDYNKMNIINEETKIVEIKNPSNVNIIPDANTHIENTNYNVNIIASQSEPILYEDEGKDIEMKNNFNKINSDTILDKKVNIFTEKNNDLISLNNNGSNNIELKSDIDNKINNDTIFEQKVNIVTEKNNDFISLNNNGNNFEFKNDIFNKNNSDTIFEQKVNIFTEKNNDFISLNNN